MYTSLCHEAVLMGAYNSGQYPAEPGREDPGGDIIKNLQYAQRSKISRSSGFGNLRDLYNLPVPDPTKIFIIQELWDKDKLVEDSKKKKKNCDARLCIFRILIPRRF